MGAGVETSSIEEGEVMDTPERTKNHQIATSITKFEDSPVFNFLNNLSPIKPVKSAHISQTINPLSFSTIPSVFTSPHVTSLKESRFLRRHQLSDPSKPEFSTDTNKAIVDAGPTKKSDELQENVDTRESDADVAACHSSYDCSKYIVDFAEGYDFSSPNASCGLKDKHVSVVPFVQNNNMEGVSQSQVIDRNQESKTCDWDSLISDATDLLIFESPNDADTYKKSMIDNGMSFYNSMDSDMQNMQSLCAEGSGEQFLEGNETENLSTQPGEGIEIIENNSETHEIVGGSSMEDNSSEKMDYEHLSGMYRGMRRRCLVFEMSGSRRKHLTQNVGPDSSSSSVLMQSDGNMESSSNGQKLAPIKTANIESTTRCVLPGIGLHLNALASTTKDYKIVGHDSSSASGRLLIGPSSSVNFSPLTIEQDSLTSVLPVTPSEREVVGTEITVLPPEDACEASGLIGNEEIGHSSPKKKRRRVEQAGEAEACKRCNCKKSKCLKLYCECFAAGVYCVEPCACIDCFNKPIHEDTVLATRKQIESRNPLAFAPKVIKGPDSLIETGDDSSKTPASARHKRGCNCKKSGCLKKYCECYQGGVGCSINCRCEGCKNAFGRKDGSGVMCMETEVEDDETETAEKNIPDRSFRKIVIENDLDHNSDSYVLPATPLQSVRQSVQLPFSSKNKPPRSSFLTIGGGSSSSFNGRQGFVRPSFALPPPKFDENKNLETVIEDNEMPDFLSSPIGGIKSSSPNGKRVSPPHGGGGGGAGASLSPGLRSSRKLILQSIPSFPSLSSNQ
ncbi:hypothetical protein ABFX02_07G034900 [Erythranthe guttata]